MTRGRWCFPTLEEFATKALGYSHVDRLGPRPANLLRPDRIQDTICSGSNFFGMLPEAYSYQDMLEKWHLHRLVFSFSFKAAFLPICDVSKRSGSNRTSNTSDLPQLLKTHPERFPYLLPGGCIREATSDRNTRVSDREAS